MVKLADLMATAEKPKTGPDGKTPVDPDADDLEEQKRKKGELTPYAKEALAVLADLASNAPSTTAR